jgi:MurNAc alpha-1-phosphate uridylyltransferase
MNILKKNMKIKTALILCAGFGKRLNPLTLETPKPLLKIKNISMLEHCINLVVSLGIKNIILNTYHLEDKIIDFIKKKNFSINIEIKKDGVKILDTGGGILNMINSSLENDFLIFNPDTLWNEKYYQDIKKMQEYYFSQNLNNILLLTKKNNSFDLNLTGDFNLKNNLITKDSKEFIFIGCQILNKELFRNYQINNFSISEIWENLLQTKGLNGYESENKFYHLTNLEIFKRLQDL